MTSKYFLWKEKEQKNNPFHGCTLLQLSKTGLVSQYRDYNYILKIIIEIEEYVKTTIKIMTC